MKALLPVLLAFLLAATQASAGEAAPGSGSAVVTSVQKCLSELDPAEEADIRRSFVKPYEECLKRRAAKKQKEQQEAVEQAKKASEPETPRNYVRVQQPKPASGEKTPEKKPEKSR